MAETTEEILIAVCPEHGPVALTTTTRALGSQLPERLAPAYCPKFESHSNARCQRQVEHVTYVPVQDPEAQAA